jgi:hypothetical protein
MSLFSFADIKFSSKPRKINSTNNLTENSQYNIGINRYPIDIGDTDKGHYMIIHVNQQKRTSFKKPTTNDLPTVLQNRNDGRSINFFGMLEGGSETLTKVQNYVGKTIDDTGLITATGKTKVFGVDEAVIQGTRTIERTTDTIALYMPDTLNFVHNQSYSDLSLNGLTAAALSTVSSIADSWSENNSVDLSSLSPFVARALRETDVGRAAFAAFTGKVVNPLLDLVYSSPALREFRFDFLFYPRSEAEALQVHQIISKLKFHQAPEIDLDTLGYFLIPPSEFDIKFYYNGKENPNIPKISTCVLTTIDVDYAPNGWSSYETKNPKPEVGGTGTPVGIRMSLQFKETEIVTKDFLDENTLRKGTVEVGNIQPAE